MAMEPSPLYGIDMHQQEAMEERGDLAMGMEVDDADAPDVLGKLERRPPDADFFNSFDDDFDDSDI